MAGLGCEAVLQVVSDGRDLDWGNAGTLHPLAVPVEVGSAEEGARAPEMFAPWVVTSGGPCHRYLA